MRFRHPLRSLVFTATGLFSIASALAGDPPTDVVSVRSDPPGAQVVVDGDQVGPTPVAIELDSREEHRIVVLFPEDDAREWIVRPALGWSLLGAAVWGGGLGVAGTIVDVSTGHGRRLVPDEILASCSP